MMRMKLVATGLICVVVMALFAGRSQAYSSFAKWGSDSAIVYANPANVDVDAAAAENAILVGLNAWSTEAGSPFRYVYGGRVNDTSTGYDSRNVVIFRNTSNGSSLATTYSWWMGTTLVDSDVIVWDGAFTSFTGWTGCSNGAYLEDVLTHELGHALGLNHSSDYSATMYAGYALCSTDMRTLAADDAAGAQSLYGQSGGTPVYEAPPPASIVDPSAAPTLTATGYKQRKSFRVNLAWAGVTSSTIDVFRNGTKVTATSNDGAWNDSQRVAGTYRYQICASGTSSCSNEASVTF